jgi:hypothetical protein
MLSFGAGSVKPIYSGSFFFNPLSGATTLSITALSMNGN